jgi:hypothetical protein
MHDSELEQELRTLRPIAPSSRLEEGIANQLEPAENECRAGLAEPSGSLLRRIFPPMAWSSIGAAAALLVVAAREGSPEQGTANVSPAIAPVEQGVTSFEPVAATEVILGATDEGVAAGSDDADPLRRLRVTSVERRTWTNPGTGAELHVEIPRQEIFLTSLAIQ